MTDSNCKRGWSPSANCHATHVCAILLLAAAAAGPASAEILPRGHRTANDITYGDWRKFCFRAGGAKTLCRTTITGTFETGQTAVRLDLIEREGARAARLQLFVPVGMYLRIPIELRVDQGRPYPLAQFATIHKSAPTEIHELDIDE